MAHFGGVQSNPGGGNSLPLLRLSLDQEKALLREYKTLVEQISDADVNRALEERNRDVQMLLGQIEACETQFLAEEAEIMRKTEGLLSKLNAVIESDVYIYDQDIDGLLQQNEAVPSQERVRMILGFQSGQAPAVSVVDHPSPALTKPAKPVQPTKATQPTIKPIKSTKPTQPTNPPVNPPKNRGKKLKKLGIHELQALFEANKQKNPIEAGKAMMKIAEISQAASDIAKAIRSYETALTYLKRDPSLEVDCKVKLAECYESGKDIEKALQTLIPTLHQEQNAVSPRPGTVIGLLRRVANCYKIRKQFDEAVEALSQALELARTCGTHTFQRQVCNALQNTYKELGRLSETVAMSGEILRLDTLNASQNRVSTVNSWIRHAKFAKECQQSDEARHACRHCLNLLTPPLSNHENKRKKSVEKLLSTLP